MAKSTFSEHLDLVQTQFTGLLRPLGFRKVGRIYNRTLPEGLVQVVNLQIWRPDPVPPTLTSPGISAGHDRFTVNLGVWIPEVSDYHLLRPRTKTIHEYDCQVRARLGEFATPPTDVWWSLDDSWHDSAAAALALLEAAGLPWLEKFGTRDGIVSGWDRASDARIVVAIEAKRGRAEAARRLLAEQIAAPEYRSPPVRSDCGSPTRPWLDPDGLGLSWPFPAPRPRAASAARLCQQYVNWT